MTGSDWFQGAVAAEPAAAAFLERVRMLAAVDLAAVVAAESTAALRDGRLITVDPRGIAPAGWPEHAYRLEVSYEPGRLAGRWARSARQHDWQRGDPEAWEVNAKLGPQDAANRAVGWLASQLRRPLVRQEWHRRGLRRARTRWVLTDTGQVVAEDRRVPKRWRMPDRYAEL